MSNSIPSFEVGQTVVLKSGGPRMTVFEVRETKTGQEVHCKWFRVNVLKTGKFPSQTLELPKAVGILGEQEEAQSLDELLKLIVTNQGDDED